MRKFLIMAIVCIAGFQQASADVCKLKVKNGENLCYGTIQLYDGTKQNYDGKWIRYEPFRSFYKLHGAYLFVFVDNNVDNFRKYKKVRCNSNDIPVDNIIYCKDTSGEVFINLNGVPNNERLKIAKRQFENIIKCGLVVPVCQCNAKGVLMEKSNTQATFNPRIFANPFTICEYENYKINLGWHMPGISVFVKDGENAANVYCAMKTECPKITTKFWMVDDYTGDKMKSFYSYEHTERQLVVNHMCDEKLSDTAQIIKYSQSKPLNKISQVNEKHYLTNGHLLIWTKGNPCTSASDDNGNNCCTKWYRDISATLGITDIYFSEFKNNWISESSVEKEVKAMCNKRIEGYVDGLARYAENYLIFDVNSLWNNIILQHGAISTLNIICELQQPTRGDTLKGYIERINGICMNNTWSKRETERRFNLTKKNIEKITFHYDF